MIDLYFANVYSILTTLLVIANFTLAITVIRRQATIQKWGRIMFLFIGIGLAISGLSAMRDGYASSNAVFSMTSIQSNICSIAGGAIFLLGFVSLLVRKQSWRKLSFMVIVALFTIQVLVIEGSRLMLI